MDGSLSPMLLEVPGAPTPRPVHTDTQTLRRYPLWTSHRLSVGSASLPAILKCPMYALSCNVGEGEVLLVSQGDRNCMTGKFGVDPDTPTPTPHGSEAAIVSLATPHSDTPRQMIRAETLQCPEVLSASLSWASVCCNGRVYAMGCEVPGNTYKDSPFLGHPKQRVMSHNRLIVLELDTREWREVPFPGQERRDEWPPCMHSSGIDMYEMEGLVYVRGTAQDAVDYDHESVISVLDPDTETWTFLPTPPLHPSECVVAGGMVHMLGCPIGVEEENWPDGRCKHIDTVHFTYNPRTGYAEVPKVHGPFYEFGVGTLFAMGPYLLGCHNQTFMGLPEYVLSVYDTVQGEWLKNHGMGGKREGMGGPKVVVPFSRDTILLILQPDGVTNHTYLVRVQPEMMYPATGAWGSSYTASLGLWAEPKAGETENAGAKLYSQASIEHWKAIDEGRNPMEGRDRTPPEGMFENW
ncbi:hypothetical protein KIPB_002667 [Kipferlia bialata]|uniref:Uncharacterized protein n=1 Tax=Kipferlia bialata TaxID=797122 RepID=A0A9K3GF46_9EUKA|nr:hypothetical protein KIPB_002667 [Kipferlia bialata]|eukprot:g2667.t1